MHTLLSTPLTASSVYHNYTPIWINLGVIAVAIIVAILVIRFIKVDQKGYKLLFVLYVLFWIPLMLQRQYTGTMQLGINKAILWLPMAAYGFIGIFARLFADWFTWMNKNRKAMIYLALLIGFITYIPIIFVQSTATNVIQSLGVGVGASMIGTFQLMFNEQHGKSKQFLTVSLLSIPPLLADFISSAIQSTISSVANTSNAKSPDTLKYLWVVGAGITVIAFVLAFFVKENRSYLYQDNKYKKPLQTNREWVYFVWICLLGSLIAFIKWANSGSIAQINIEVLANHNAGIGMPWDKIDGKDVGSVAASYEGYLSLLFSMGQLFGGLITGLVLIGRIGKMWTFTIGCGVWVVYEVLGIYIHNPYGYLGIHVLNGFSYGVVYNLVLGFILQKTFKNEKVSPMGAYQSVMSVGIMSSSFFTTWLKGGPLKQGNYHAYFKAAEIINWTIIAAIVVAWLLFMYTWLIERWDYKKLWFGNRAKQLNSNS